jgi:hypothetical protein
VAKAAALSTLFNLESWNISGFYSNSTALEVSTVYKKLLTDICEKNRRKNLQRFQGTNFIHKY